MTRSDCFWLSGTHDVPNSSEGLFEQLASKSVVEMINIFIHVLCIERRIEKAPIHMSLPETALALFVGRRCNTS